MLAKNSVIQGIDRLLSSLKSTVANQVFENKTLPLLGNKLNTSSAVQFIDDIKNAVIKELDKVVDNLDTTTIKDALVKALGANGLNLIQGDITVLESGDNVNFNVQLSKDKLTGNSFSTPIATDIGLPNLGLTLSSKENPANSPQANVNLGFNFDLSFSVNKTNSSVFFNYGESKDNELSINLDASIPQDLKTTGKLGVIQLDITKVNFTGLNSSFSVDLDSQSAGLVKNVKPDVTANINFDAQTSFDRSTVLPSLGFIFNLSWRPFEQNNSNPNIAFNNVTLNLGSFFEKYATPVLGNIKKVLEPLDSITGILKPTEGALTRKIELFDKLGSAKEFLDRETRLTPGKITLLDLVKFVDPNLDLSFLTAAADVLALADSVKNISVNEANINLGSFNLKDLITKEIQVAGAKTGADVETQLQASPAALEFINKLKQLPSEKGSSGFDFKLLTEPTTAFNLLLGQSATLFTYDMPALNFFANFNQFFPIVGPLGVKLQGTIGSQKEDEVDLAFGYEYNPNQPANLSGFFVSDRINPDGTGAEVPEISLESRLEAFAALDVAVASAGAGGGLQGVVNLDLNDPNKDGKLFFNEIEQILNTNPLCIFDPISGSLNASLRAYVSFGFGPFKRTEYFDGPSTTLATFEFGCSGTGQPGTGTPPTLATKLDRRLRLNIGPDAAARQVGNTADGSEVFRVNHKSGLAGNEAVTVSAFGFTQDYANLSKIIARGGESADTIELAANVVTPAELFGDKGSDLIVGGGGRDIIDGGDDPDQIVGGGGVDRLIGGSGSDLLVGGADADRIDGGEGIDTASYKTATAGVDINLETGIGSRGDATGDSFVSIENLEGSNSADTLTGNAQNNNLLGLDGDDILSGRDGDDFLLGGAGADTLDGGLGNDSTSYAASKVGVSIDLRNSSASGGEAQGDTLFSIENVEGSNFADTLIGDDAANTLNGMRGPDVITGLGGNDILCGGLDFENSNIFKQQNTYGPDVLVGGEGGDTFVIPRSFGDFEDAQYFPQVIIEDFNPNEDRIALPKNISFQDFDFFNFFVESPLSVSGRKGISVVNTKSQIANSEIKLFLTNITDSSTLSPANFVTADESFGLT